MVTPSKQQSGQFAFGSSSTPGNGFPTPLHNVSNLEPELQVIFKGLQKRDATTRVKATEDLILYADKAFEGLPESLAEPLVGAFMSLYPTLSIDVERRIRANVHVVLGMLVHAYKKKTVRQLSDCAPYWQMGLHDCDRTVSKAATDALEKAFPSSEKQFEFKRLFRTVIADRCMEMAVEEDATSLSDSRFVSKDDADAKYNNTCAAALSVLTDVLSHDKSKQSLLLSDNRFWKLIQATDVNLQKSGLTLVAMIVETQGIEILTKTNSFKSSVASLINHVSITNLLQLLSLLRSIASISPDTIFLDDRKSKKSIPARILKIIRNGPAPGTSNKYWNDLSLLIQFAKSCGEPVPDTIEPFLAAYHASTSHAARDQALAARIEYVKLCTALFDCVSATTKDHLWNFFSSDIREIGKLDSYKDSLAYLHVVSGETVESIMLSLESQVLLLLNSVAESDLTILKSWANLVRDLATSEIDSPRRLSSLRRSITEALLSDQSKDVAYLYVCHAIKMSPFEDAAKHVQELRNFFSKDASKAFARPNETTEMLAHLRSATSTKDIDALLHTILSSAQSNTSIADGLVSRICTTDFGMKSQSLINWFLGLVSEDSEGKKTRWRIYKIYARNNSDLTSISKTLLPMIDAAAHESDQANDALELITELCSAHIDLIESCELKPDQFMEVIWRLARSAEFAKLLQTFGALMNQKSKGLTKAMQTSVWAQVVQTSADSVAVQQIHDVFECTHCSQIPSDVLAQDFNKALISTLPSALPSDLTIVEPLGVLTYSIPSAGESNRDAPTFDNQGLSTCCRIYYVLKRSESLSDQIQIQLLVAEALLLAKQQHPLANMIFDTNIVTTDQIGLLDQWQSQPSPFLDHAVHIFNNGTDQDANSFLASLGMSSEPRFLLHWYQAFVLYRILIKTGEHGIQANTAETIYNLCSTDLFFNVACALALNENLSSTKKFSFQTNKLASDLTGDIQESKAATALVQLNSHLSQDNSETTAIPRQRLIFLIKNLLDYSMKHKLAPLMSYEILTLLLRVLPDVASEYGTFWQGVINVLHKVLASTLAIDSDISPQYSALKLTAWLWTSFESNDDLSEAWINAQLRTEELVAQSFLSAATKPHNNQASTVCSLIASRLVRKVRPSAIDNFTSTSLTALISNSAEHTQLTAYAVQSQLVDRQREEIILAAALAKEYEDISAAFPPELLSIVLDCSIEEVDIYDHIGPLSTSQRGYFMAWVLIFQFFKDTPLRMRVKLISDLDEMDLIEPLLAVIFAIMKLLDDVPADIGAYSKPDLDLELIVESGNEMLAYAVHLYYACLTHVPALVRAWWIECKDRRLTSAVEQLTVKHYSLALIQHDVQTLQSEQSKSVLKDDNLTVRISNGGRDIFTTYEIDEQNMEMAIRLPPNYPLRRVAVEGVQRVGVKDTLWRAWLLGSQAVLTAQNGSVLDAISLFQRNVSLHFEGVAECNICFSVLSVQDKSLPSKKCQTCKNLFHSSCLFKWFKSSSQSRCPLCRTSFAF